MSLERNLLIGALLAGSLADAAVFTVDCNSPFYSKYPSTANVLPVWNTTSVMVPDWVTSNFPDYVTPYTDQVVMMGFTGGRAAEVSDGKGGTKLVSAFEMYTEDANHNPIYPISPTTQFFKTIDLLRSKGIKPIICIGSTPFLLSARQEYGPFLADKGEPKDYAKYRTFIKEWTKAMLLKYPAAEVNGWEYRLLWEPDNTDMWLPLAGSGKTGFDAFKLCWSATVNGMHDGGLAKPILNPGNLMIPTGTGSWLPNLAAYLFGQSGAATIKRFSFSLYGGLKGVVGYQMGNDPRDLANFAGKIRYILDPYFPNVEISVDEGGLYQDENGIAMVGTEGTEVGAAWAAAILKRALDNNWKYYANWFGSTNGAVDGKSFYNGVKTPSFFTYSMFELLEGGKRLDVLPNGQLPSPLDDDAIAVKHSDGRIGILVYSYAPNRNAVSHTQGVQIKGLKANTNYHLKHYLIDKNHANFTTALFAEMNKWNVRTIDAKGNPASRYDGFVSSFLRDVPGDMNPGSPYSSPRDLWIKKRPELENLAVFALSKSDGSKVVKSTSAGEITVSYDMQANSVGYYDLVESQGNDTYGNPIDTRSIYATPSRFTSDNRSDMAITGVPGFASIPIAAPASNGTIQVLNNGLANFPGFASSPYARIVAGDFDGDTFTDLAVTGVAGWYSVPVAFSNGAGAFSSTNIGIPDFPRLASDPRSKVFTGRFDAGTFSDIALIGSPDIGGVALALGTSSRGFTYRLYKNENLSKLASNPKAKILSGDFNNDGRTDFAITGVPGWTTIPLARSTTTGDFQFTNTGVGSFPAKAAATGAEVVVGDFDGDKKADLAVIGVTGSTIPVARSNGDGSFQYFNANIGADFPSWSASPGAKMLIGDFNGDGRSDIAIQGPSGWHSIPVAFGKVDGSFNIVNSGVANFPVFAATPGVEMLVGDYNGDGRSDIALTGVSGWSSIPVAYGNVDGSFTEANIAAGSFPDWAALVQPH